MIKLEVDGPTNTCHISVEANSAQLLAEATIIYGALLAELENFGFPIEITAKMIGEQLGGIITDFRKEFEKEKEE